MGVYTQPHTTRAGIPTARQKGGKEKRVSPALPCPHIVRISCGSPSGNLVGDVVAYPLAEPARSLPRILGSLGDLQRLLDEDRIVRFDEPLRVKIYLQGFVVAEARGVWRRLRTVVLHMLDLEDALDAVFLDRALEPLAGYVQILRLHPLSRGLDNSLHLQV